MKLVKILVPTDFSENALLAFKAACGIARSADASIDLLHVQSESDLRVAITEDLYTRDSTDASVARTAAEIEDARFGIVMAGVNPDLDIRRITVRGHPQESIREFASANSADLMVLGMRGSGIRESLKTAVLGSVADAMVNNSPCPVLLVRMNHKTLVEK